MKKITLIAAVIFSVFSANTTSAQTFTLDAASDTSKAWWKPGGYPVEISVNAMTSSSTPIEITWRIVDFQKGSKWTFDGFCDNNLCRYDGTPGLTNGLSSFNNNGFSVGEKANFKLDWGADTADFGTMSSLTVEMTNGSTTKFISMNGYKSVTGLHSAVRVDDEVTIFPNPASNYIDVLYSASSDVKSVAIYNLIGKLVSVYKVSDKNSARCTFNADMPSGIYLVRIADSKGTVIATRKITRQ